MKAIKTLLLFLILFSASALLVNTAPAEIKITDADAIFETSLQSMSIPTQAIPLTRLFINSEDAVLTKNLSTVSIPTQAATLTRLFINSEDAILTKSLSSVSIPTQAIPVTKLFIFSADAILTKDLVSLSGQPPPVKPSILSFTLSLDEGLNMVSLPLQPQTPFTARDFAGKLGATTVISFDATEDKFIPFVPEVFTGDGFPIKGGQGYIVNVLKKKDVVFTGTGWSDVPSETLAAPPLDNSTWAFVVAGTVFDEDGEPLRDAPIHSVVENTQNHKTTTCIVGQLEAGKFAAALVDMNRKAVVFANELLKIHITDAAGNVISGPITYRISVEDIAKGYAKFNMRLGDIIPEKSALLQNYPNPFNPETWIPYQLPQDTDVTISIYNIKGQLIRTLRLGQKPAGMYISKERAAHWNGRDEHGEMVSSGVYFYSIEAGNFRATRKLVVAK